MQHDLSQQICSIWLWFQCSSIFDAIPGILLVLTIYFPMLMQHSCVPSLKHLFHVLLLQNIVSVTIVSTLSLSGAVPTEPLTWNLIKVWLPVNIIFVGMLITSMFRYVADLQRQFGLSTVCCAIFLDPYT